ncbi:alpha/beta hydrolase [Sphingomonas sp. TREG-RG-20F-R18-01]|uniref:alpha/beta fold hydrolase n=1 Tax=Sphingomonas sp. TREG-RG-20F-R18-01 TaxID=2914982 RepID=UPI001F55E468|nr:alpha/beta hydrolase [Sphingomonas sp. TREG-RG-20F-R18-01]
MRTRTTLAAIVIALSSRSALLAQSVARPITSAAQELISAVVEGKGPDVILIPGLASSREVWSGLADKLKQTHRLHLVQIAGFAGTPAVADPGNRVAAPSAEVIAAYIRRERIKAPVIIGHSLGGEVALMLGARHPGEIGRLLIVDALPFYSLLFSPTATVAAVTPRAVAFRDAMMAAPTDQANAMQSAAIARLVKTEMARPAVIAAGVRSDRKTVADATYELMTTDLRSELKRITAPVEVIYAYDKLYGVPPASIDTTFQNAYASTPQVRFKRIDDSFHFVMLDQPDTFERAVIEFVEQRPPVARRLNE